MIETKEVKRGEWILKKLPDDFSDSDYELEFYIGGKLVCCFENSSESPYDIANLTIEVLLNPCLKDGE